MILSQSVDASGNVGDDAIPRQLLYEQIPQAGEVSPDEIAVRVSSLHGAKGHEFGTVFVLGAVEGVIPMGADMDAQTMSSEAAVLYVGMTRARDLLYLSYSEIDTRGKDLSRSSFIDRIAKWCDFAAFRR